MSSGPRRPLWAAAAAVLLLFAACGDDADSDAGAGTGTSPDSTTDTQPADGSATLRPIGSCDEVAAVLGDYIAGFKEGTTGFNVEEERYDCPWKREPDPEGKRIYAIAVSAVFTNTPDFATDDWEAAGLERLEDPRVSAFGGLLLLQDAGPAFRTVFIEAPGFRLHLQSNGRDLSHLSIDEMVDLMLQLVDTDPS